jgi:hypothetical protein
MPKTLFISCSGQRSVHIAKSLNEWLSELFSKHLRIELSPEMEPGVRWFGDISKILEEADYGILCLTPENLDRPWIHFEAGAISKAVGQSRVYPYLYFVEVSSLKSPLNQFKAVKAIDKEENWTLVNSLYGLVAMDAMPAITSENMRRLFDSMWPDLQMRLEKTHAPEMIQTSERSDRAILEEILESIRGADASKYLRALSKPQEEREREIEPFMLTTALHTVIRWILGQLDMPYTHRSNIDYEIVINEQTVLVETKIGNLLDQDYLQATLNQVEKAYKETGAASAIIVIPDHPPVSDELNRKQCLAGLLFFPITKLREHLESVQSKPSDTRV